MMNTTQAREGSPNTAERFDYGVEHFVRCYRQGGHGAASTGEQAAYKLGQALLENIGAPSDIDSDCLNGFIELVCVAHTGYDGMALVARILMGRRVA